MPRVFVGKNDGNVKLLLPNQQQWGREMGFREWARPRDTHGHAAQVNAEAKPVEARRIEARRIEEAGDKKAGAQRGKGKGRWQSRPVLRQKTGGTVPPAQVLVDGVGFSLLPSPLAGEGLGMRGLSG